MPLEMLIVRDGKFREPNGGWGKTGRHFVVVEDAATDSIGRKC